jgi:hypothetical protein
MQMQQGQTHETTMSARCSDFISSAGMTPVPAPEAPGELW